MASTSGLKEAMHDYLRGARAGCWRESMVSVSTTVVWPMTPTGPYLLGLVKHLTFYESCYLGGVFGREPEWTLPWIENDSVWQGADMRAKPDEPTHIYSIGIGLRVLMPTRRSPL